MKKIVIAFCAAVLAVSAGLLIKSHSRTELFNANVEALTDHEATPSVGYKRKTFDIKVGYDDNIGGGLEVHYKTISCCVKALFDYHSCNFSVDDAECANRIDSEVIGGRVY